MKTILYTLSFLVLLITESENCCGQSKFGPPRIAPETLTANFQTWWTYQYNDIALDYEFVALDEQGGRTTKELFLKKLKTGKFISIELESTDGSLYYQLFQLSADADPSIGRTMSNTAAQMYIYFKREETPFPQFHFTDLNGKTYTNQSVKGKTVFLKCWFIHCQACVKEFPELNAFQEEYEKENNVVFISLAFDTKEELQQFLQKKPFNYAVVANKESYMIDTLKVGVFPTHFIIDPQGKIKKVTGRADRMIAFYKKGL